METRTTNSPAYRAERAAAAFNATYQGMHDEDRVRDLLQDVLHWLASRHCPDPVLTMRIACKDAIRDFGSYHS